MEADSGQVKTGQVRKKNTDPEAYQRRLNLPLSVVRSFLLLGWVNSSGVNRALKRNLMCCPIDIESEATDSTKPHGETRRLSVGSRWQLVSWITLEDSVTSNLSVIVHASELFVVYCLFRDKVFRIQSTPVSTQMVGQ